MSRIPTKQTSTSPPTKVVFRSRQNTAAGFQQRKSLNIPWKIGDRVLTNGKSGTVAFIGQTRFAEGEWIGISLDEALGKNDGSYNGHRYFQSDPNHGLFCRPDAVQTLSITNALQRKTVHDPTRLSFIGTTTNSVLPNAKPEKVDIQIGDRVLVSGTRMGTVKYLGPTHIKEGIWCGIKLEQPDGKHNGKLDGKRYFRCSHRYGLFAPLHRVEKVAVDPADVRQSTMSTDSNDLLLDHSSSHTSLLSEFSSSSNEMPVKSSQKARHLSLSTDLTAMETNLSSQVAELHEIIKEKDMFIKQLQQQKLERDRYELSKLNSLENQLVELEHLCQKKEQENEKLLKEQLEMMERIEDLQYQVEESELGENQLPIPEDQIRIYEKSQDLELLNQKLVRENSEQMKSLQLELENRKRNEQLHIENELRFQQQLQASQLKIEQLNQIQADMRSQITILEQNKDPLANDEISQSQQSQFDFYKQQLEEYQTNINQAKLDSEQIHAELSSLQNDNHLKNQQIEDLKHAYEQTQIQLKTRDEEIELTLNEYQAKYEQQIREYEGNLNRATEETERIRTELAKFEEEKVFQEKRTSLVMSSLKEEYENSRRQEQDATDQELNQTIEKLTKDCEEYQREIEELIERECKANKTLHQREAQFDQQIEDYRDKLEQSDEQNKRLNAALEESKHRNQTDIAPSKDSESKIEQFLLEIQSLHTRLKCLEEENLSKENQLTNLRQNSQEQIEHAKQLQNEYEQKIQSQSEELQSKLISNEEFDLLKQNYEESQRQFEQERERTASLREQIQSNETELEKQVELSNTINSLTLELDSLKIELTNRDQTHQTTLKDYEKLQDDFKQKEHSIYKECRAQCEQEIDEYQKGLELSIQRIAELQSELANVQEEKELDENNFQEKFDLYKTDCEKQIENLRKKNQNLEKEYENTNEQLKDFQSTYDQTSNLYHQIEDLTQSNQQLKSELEHLANSTELDQLTEQLNQLQEMHKNLLEKHASREQEYQNDRDGREKQIQEKLDDYEMKLAMMKSEFMVEMENQKLDHDQEVLRLKTQIPKGKK